MAGSNFMNVGIILLGLSIICQVELLFWVNIKLQIELELGLD